MHVFVTLTIVFRVLLLQFGREVTHEYHDRYRAMAHIRICVHCIHMYDRHMGIDSNRMLSRGSIYTMRTKGVLWPICVLLYIRNVHTRSKRCFTHTHSLAIRTMNVTVYASCYAYPYTSILSSFRHCLLAYRFMCVCVFANCCACHFAIFLHLLTWLSVKFIYCLLTLAINLH